MPMPLSATASSTESRPSATLRTRKATSPSFVNLQALLSRLSRICFSLMESAISAPTFSCASTMRRFLFFSASCLGRRSTSLDHVLRDAGLRDLEAELEQLAMDARRTPQRIFRAHPTDQRAQFRIDLRSASKRAGFPPPVPAKAGPMPTYESLGPDDRDGPEDRWEPSIQLDQEHAIPVREVNATAHPPLQHNQLMSERRVLCRK